jgi:hypothetical protein
MGNEGAGVSLRTPHRIDGGLSPPVVDVLELSVLRKELPLGLSGR